MNSIVLDNSLEAFIHWSLCCCWWKFNCDANLKQLTSWNALLVCWSSGTNSQTFINNSIDAWKQRRGAVIRDNGAHIEQFSIFFTNFTVW